MLAPLDPALACTPDVGRIGERRQTERDPVRTRLADDDVGTLPSVVAIEGIERSAEALHGLVLDEEPGLAGSVGCRRALGEPGKGEGLGPRPHRPADQRGELGGDEPSLGRAFRNQ